jgi:hypothetical protein
MSTVLAIAVTYSDHGWPASLSTPSRTVAVPGRVGLSRPRRLGYASDSLMVRVRQAWSLPVLLSAMSQAPTCRMASAPAAGLVTSPARPVVDDCCGSSSGETFAQARGFKSKAFHGLLNRHLLNSIKRISRSSMTRIFESLLAGVATYCAGLWLLKEMENANNVAVLEATNPMIAVAMKSVDGLCGNESSKALKLAAYTAAKMRNPDEVMLQDSWNRLRSLIKAIV